MDLTNKLTALRRPRLLVATARAGLGRYRSGDATTAILSHPGLPTEDALDALFDLEQSLNQKRRQQAPDYEVTRHVGLLTAIMGEAAALSGPKASALT
jgi:hypothetical protein